MCGSWSATSVYIIGRGTVRNKTQIYLHETGLDSFDWIYLAQDRAKWWVFKHNNKLWITQNAGNFL
jgi:hypothetical protein